MCGMRVNDVSEEVTGDPRWQLAREVINRLYEMPTSSAEREVDTRLHSILTHLFPNLRYPDIAVDFQSGDGLIDVYCRNVVFENKRQGKLDARRKPDGTTETPEEQATRYLNALTSRPNMFDQSTVGWRAVTSDGKEWKFYDYQRDSSGGTLTGVNTLHLNNVDDIESLLEYLYEFVDRSVKMTPPIDNAEWVNQLVQPFLELARQCEDCEEYDIKRVLWRGLLRGAFLNPIEDASAERDLFARHTMLVVIARTVAETLKPFEAQIRDDWALSRHLTEGFSAWLLDAAGQDGQSVLNDLVSKVNNYAWQSTNRDILKNLYHAVIPREIRHDFGEYYTPDWLARAVCEEVLDADWRSDTISNAIGRHLVGPAVLDPSCGSGTFLFHATQLLLEEASLHPELAMSPQAQVRIVDQLVSGMDLHPVAVELSKTTKMLAFGELAVHYAEVSDSGNVHLCDSLQWDIQSRERTIGFEELVEIPSDHLDEPIRLPATLLLRDNFPQLLSRIFDYARDSLSTDDEHSLVEVLNLPTGTDQEATIAASRQLHEYIVQGRNNVWQWYISNLVQPLRIANMPATRLVGNPPWVVFNSMDDRCPKCNNLDEDCEHRPGRQETFRQHAMDRDLWASSHLATQNDLAATFVATCVDYYLESEGKFGFVLPYAALEARQWSNFRGGNWNLRVRSGRAIRGTERSTHVDLSKDAWDLSGVHAPPFPQASSSVVFGAKVRGNRLHPAYRPLTGIQEAHGNGVEIGMSWEDVQPLLRWESRREWPMEPSTTYANAFSNGATLFPQSLVVVDQPSSQAQGIVYFQTRQGTGGWVIDDADRYGFVEERFIRPALFSRLLLPFGANSHDYIIAPFGEGDEELLGDLPSGDNATHFRLYWDRVDRIWRQRRSERSPDTLIGRLNYQGNLASQLSSSNAFKVVYNTSGSNLHAAVVDSSMIASHTLNWLSLPMPDANYYLAAIFNAKCLNEFFREACRASDRHFMLLPVQRLPIPSFDPDDANHSNLAHQSRLAHSRVENLLAERQAVELNTNRNAVLRDEEMRTILDSIDDTVRAILPDYAINPGQTA